MTGLFQAVPVPATKPLFLVQHHLTLSVPYTTTYLLAPLSRASSPLIYLSIYLPLQLQVPLYVEKLAWSIMSSELIGQAQMFPLW